jgi:hypothetical protein
MHSLIIEFDIVRMEHDLRIRNAARIARAAGPRPAAPPATAPPRRRPVFAFLFRRPRPA